jgi:transglutaminase superfamily protein
MKLTRIPHLDGDPGVAQTIKQMRRLIQQGKQDPTVHELAAQILRRANVRAYDWEGEARAVFEAVRRNLRFTRDVNGNETLHAAPDIIRLGIADCDDFTILICSLMETIGCDTRIVTIAVDQDGEFCHVYPEAEINGRWCAMDAARQSAAFGKSPEHYTRKRVWEVHSEGFTDMAGIRMNVAPGQGPQGAWSPRVYPPFRLAAREMTGTYLRAFPVAPPHQQFKRPPLGHGNYGVPAARRALGDFSRDDLRRTLGQDDGGFDWSTLGPIIQAGTTGAANIISAERASPYNLFPTTSMTAAARPPLSTSMMAPISSIGAVPSWVWMGGALLLGAVVLEGRR